MDKSSTNENRRSFLKLGFLTTASVAAVGIGMSKVFSEDKPAESSGKKVKVMTADGKLVEVDSSHLKCCTSPPVSNEEARKGISGKKFVMVIDLAKCDGCATCTVSCQKMHHTPTDREWMKVFKMQDNEKTAPYFFPKPCYHCDNPPCTKVCPVNATFKRQDGIVLIDNERCIGCRFCMAACPYSTRFFNWDKPEESAEIAAMPYSPEQSFPRKMGTVEKCDFCPHMLREGKLPDCVANCAMNALYMGDANEDAVTSSSGETVQLSKLLEDNAGFRYMEELGTEPRVYYLPPKNRRYPKPEMHKEKEDEKKNNEMKNMKM